MLEKALVSAANLKRFTENLCNESYPLSDGRAEEVDELERRWPWKATTRSCRRQIGCILQLAKFIGELGRLPFWAHTFICLERYNARVEESHGCCHWVRTLIGSVAKPSTLSAAALGSSCTISSVYLQHQMQREHRGGQDGVAPRTVGVAMRPRMDVIVPFGLNKFLSSVCQRPRLFEQLCHALWEMERSGREYASMPGWYRDTCLIIAVSCVRLRLCSTCHVSATI